MEDNTQNDNATPPKKSEVGYYLSLILPGIAALIFVGIVAARTPL
jgi:hypothetical protein